jgi:hypothetical protein
MNNICECHLIFISYDASENETASKNKATSENEGASENQSISRQNRTNSISRSKCF